ncbi:MAG: SDR family oxidoreductase [Anaerolineae bacterium]|nr:SDR family oxidoreductase [Anaerolineae bacterium]NUQ06354.1 SDR family oxidoreductase [Anaerolineae bacterium]
MQARFQPLPNEGRLDGKVLVITGSTQGQGEAFAQRAAYLGAAGIVICGRSEDKGAAVVKSLEEIGAQALFVKADLASAEDCRAVMRACDARFGRVDGLVNSAGHATRGTLETTTVELWDWLFALNVRAPFILMQDAVRIMRREDIKGSIVNIQTMSAYGGQPDLMAYSSSKAALSALTKNAAYQLQPYQIRVNALNIGWTNTPGEHVTQMSTGMPEDWLQAADASRPFKRLLLPEDIAPMVTYLLSDMASMVTGSVIDWDQTINGPYGAHEPVFE